MAGSDSVRPRHQEPGEAWMERLRRSKTLSCTDDDNVGVVLVLSLRNISLHKEENEQFSGEIKFWNSYSVCLHPSDSSQLDQKWELRKRFLFELYCCNIRLKILYLWIQKIIYIKLCLLLWRRGFGNIEGIEDDIDEGDDENQDRGGIIQFVSSPNARIYNFQLLIIIILSPKIPLNSGSTFEMKE